MKKYNWITAIESLQRLPRRVKKSVRKKIFKNNKNPTDSVRYEVMTRMAHRIKTLEEEIANMKSKK